MPPPRLCPRAGVSNVPRASLLRVAQGQHCLWRFAPEYSHGELRSRFENLLVLPRPPWRLLRQGKAHDRPIADRRRKLPTTRGIRARRRPRRLDWRVLQAYQAATYLRQFEGETDIDSLSAGRYQRGSMRYAGEKRSSENHILAAKIAAALAYPHDRPER